MNEAIRATTDKETRIIVNDKARIISVPSLTYAAVCQLAGQPFGATVIWDSADRLTHRSMFDGETVEVKPLMRFTVVMTDKS